MKQPIKKRRLKEPSKQILRLTQENKELRTRLRQACLYIKRLKNSNNFKLFHPKYFSFVESVDFSSIERILYGQQQPHTVELPASRVRNRLFPVTTVK